MPTSRFAVIVIALTFCQPSVAQEEVPRVEFFAVAGVGPLLSELSSASPAVDFGQVSSSGGGNFGAAIGFRPISRLGIEFEGFGIGQHSLQAQENDVVTVDKEYTGNSLSGNVLFHPHRVQGRGEELWEPYVVGGLGMFNLESTTTETLPGPLSFLCFLVTPCNVRTAGESEISSSTSNEFAYNVGVGVKGYAAPFAPWFSMRPEYRFFGSSSVKLHRLSIALGFTF